MIGYHYSPVENRESIARHGLLVPKLHPRLTTPVTCADGHRNPHISLARSPHEAWILSGGFMYQRIISGDRQSYFNTPEYWDLYQVQLHKGSYRSDHMELKSRKDIAPLYVVLVGTRTLREWWRT